MQKCSNLSALWFGCVQSSCVYVLMCFIKVGLGPIASQEDRRGSRWICLDLTLPTPLHPLGPPFPTCTPLCRVEWRGLFVCMCMCVYVCLCVRACMWLWVKTESRQTKPEGARKSLPLQTFAYRFSLLWTMLTYGSCCHVGNALVLGSLSPALHPLWYSLLSALSAKPALCLFVPRMSCLFWDVESPHPTRSTGCLPIVLATLPPSFLLWPSQSSTFTCKHIIAVGSMLKKINFSQSGTQHYTQYTFFVLRGELIVTLLFSPISWPGQCLSTNMLRIWFAGDVTTKCRSHSTVTATMQQLKYNPQT